MLTIGNKIRKVLPDVKPRIEKRWGVELGEIDVKSLFFYTGANFRRALRAIYEEENFSNREKLIVDLVGIPIATGLAFTHLLMAQINPFNVTMAKADDSTIYYNSNPILNLTSLSNENEIESVVAHELGHIVHSKLVGKSLGSRYFNHIPTNVVEGFADYVSRRDRMDNKFGWVDEKVFDHYGGHLKYFRKEMNEKGFTSESDILDFLRSF